MKIKFNSLNRKIHYWGSLTCSIPILLVIITGVILLLKKDFAWIQPPTMKGSAKVPTIEFSQIINIAKNVKEAEIQGWNDINRLDIRPKKGVIKIRSNNSYEIQIDHQTGKILQISYRRSDFIESLHDGTFFSNKFSRYVFLPSSIILLILWITGIYLFITITINKQKLKKRKKQAIQDSAKKMKKLLIFTILAQIILANSAHSFDYNRKIILRKKLEKFTILGDIDYRNNQDGLFHRHYDAGLKMPLGKSQFNIALKYRLIYRKTNNYWDLREQRPQLQLSRNFNNSLFKFKTRFRQEYRILEGGDQKRLRFRFDIKSNKSLLKMKPFINNEFFYAFKYNRYNKNRSEIGVALPKIFNILTPEIAYRINRNYDEDLHKWEDNSSIIFRARIIW